MTWYFDPDGATIDIYDHTGAKVREGVMFNGSWSGRFPRGPIFHAMYAEARAAYNDAGGTITEYVLLTLADATFEQIEQGMPPV